MSLVELFVVITIILIVASIVFSVLNNSRREAKRVACTSNLYQLGLALNLYRNDWDDKKPMDNIIRSRPYGRLAWQLLTPYAKSDGVFHCSEDPRFDRVGYVYRAFIRSPDQMQFRVPLGTDSSSMAAWCIYHLKTERIPAPSGLLDNPVFGPDNHYEGWISFVRNDASSFRVNAKAVDTYVSDGKDWYKFGSEPDDFVSIIRTERYLDEPWPPEFPQ